MTKSKNLDAFVESYGLKGWETVEIFLDESGKFSTLVIRRKDMKIHLNFNEVLKLKNEQRQDN